MTPSTMSWHGQAEQSMMLRGRSVLAGVPDAQGTPPWTRVARRVWSAFARNTLTGGPAGPR
eukprot:scaffold13042_cov36-Phaeocystis_antarctica.AAC.2